jgi:pyruvate,orthophosphate dikinase
MTQAVLEQPLADASSSSTEQYVFFFGGGKADGNGKMKDVLGGKGAGLAEMTNAGLPVPPGFTIQTEACREYMRGKLSPKIDEEMLAALAKLEKLQGQKLGTGDNPLLVSVRSGAKFSMPGMMDTILNLGLNDQAVEALAKRSDNPRFAYDSYRRLIQMFGDVVLDIPKKKFEHIFDGIKAAKKVKFDYDLKPDALQKIIAEYKKLVKKETGKDFPQNPGATLRRPRCRFQELAKRSRQDLSPHQPHRRLDWYRSQRAGHGLRQPGRELRHWRRLYAQSSHRRAHVLWRVPDERAG